MWLYPFKNYYLKSPLNRSEIHQKILAHTFLSDAGYQRKDENPRYFFGTASDELFSLQTIHNQKNLVPYIEGEIKGIEKDIYLFLNLKAWKYRRMYISVLLFTLICLIVFVEEIVSQGTMPFHSMSFLILTFILFGLSLYIVAVCYFFWRVQAKTLDFFLNHLSASIIAYRDIPIVLKL